jgi:hypothetical protein
MATQAAVLAGFTTTCLIEINIPATTSPFAKSILHLAAIFSICSNITCVSLSTITSIWGSGKALRGKDGSMDEAVEGMNNERSLIFKSFASGLAGNLMTVLAACIITMEFPTSIVASCGVLYTAWLIYHNACRIQNKFHLADAVRLDDLTRYASGEVPTRNYYASSEREQTDDKSDPKAPLLVENKALPPSSNRRKSAFDIV